MEQQYGDRVSLDQRVTTRGTTMTTASGYSKKVSKPERVELIRRLLIAGVPEWKIKRMIVDGVDMGDGRVAKVNRATVGRDLEAIGIAYSELHDSPLVRERVVGACHERLTRIADTAEAAGNYHAAIRANVAIVDIMGRRWERWGRGRETAEVTSSGSGPRGEYEGMTDAELIAEHAAKQARTLRLLKGGKG